jgi:glycosyltransferase involved in cell wall biosynthesis
VKDSPSGASAHGAPILTIITPVYNGGRLLREGLLQSMADFGSSDDVQWVVVNDASNDVETLDSLAGLRRTANVTVVDLEANVGPGEARNRGFAQARGTWTAFVDSDDWCDVEGLIRACTHSAIAEADVLSLAYGWRARTGRTHVVSGGSPGDDIRGLLSRRPAVWRFIFRSRFLEHGPQFPELRYGEDLTFLLHMARLNPAVLVLPCQVGVTYREPDSKRCVSEEDRSQLLGELATLRKSSISDEERACIDSWALRVMVHGLRRDAAASLRELPYPPSRPLATARALRYTLRPYLKSVWRKSGSLVSHETRFKGARSW